ncbi:TniB family NTP-binding protein [Streptomyces sp. ISL-86]|nr:TniB family NTP-binding protein [Streptomyces sp. ISL-86]MBT2456746.1 TniB family NTP-binding protein [Streptomyces sp. ISL-86]
MTHGSAPAGPTPGQDASPTTWELFQRFARDPAPGPPRPGDPPRTGEQRLAYHSRFVTVRTPAVVQTSLEVRTLMVLGRHQRATARPALIVTGPPTTGKTTTLLEVGRTCHLAEQTRSGSAASQVPVAYLLVPPGATAKTLAAEFARFLGIPVSPRMTQTQIATAVCHTYNTTGVRLVMIDEIHRLNPRTTTGAEAADFLKDLTERIAATFVYAGIDVTHTALFTGTAGAQLAGRASLIDCDPLPATTRTPTKPSSPHGTNNGNSRETGGGQPFRDLVTAMENALDLEHHRPSSLARIAPYLHQRTAGRIGSLSRLLRRAAITAILDGTEKITRDALDAITLDHLAEQHYRPARPTTATRARPRT